MKKYTVFCEYDGVPTYIGGVDSLDVATKKWGGRWRIPSPEDFQELIDNCRWIYTDDYENKGVAGYVVMSLIPGYTDRFIFLPTADRIEGKRKLKTSCGRYWTDTKDNFGNGAYYLEFDVYDMVIDVSKHRYDRCCGQRIRPVYD